MLVDDPDYKQVRREFLEYVRTYHESVGFSQDWQRLCQAESIHVRPSEHNLHSTLGSESLITYDPRQPRNRLLFTGLHELAHHLFRSSEHGFDALLEDKYDLGLARQLEEDLCDEAAGLLLHPDHEFAKVIAEFGVTPLAATFLHEERGSLAAALMRLVLAMDFDIWGIVLRDRRVEFSCTNTRFNIGKDHIVEESHPVHEAIYGPTERNAPIPYRSGSRRVRTTMRAEARENRTVALFASRFPALPGVDQPRLFP